MTYTTQFGDKPTHVLPEDLDLGFNSHKVYVFVLEEGESIPNPASTKRLIHGPSTLLVSGTRHWDLGREPGAEWWEADSIEDYFHLEPFEPEDDPFDRSGPGLKADAIVRDLVPNE